MLLTTLLRLGVRESRQICSTLVLPKRFVIVVNVVPKVKEDNLFECIVCKKSLKTSQALSMHEFWCKNKLSHTVIAQTNKDPKSMSLDQIIDGKNKYDNIEKTVKSVLEKLKQPLSNSRYRNWLKNKQLEF